MFEMKEAMGYHVCFWLFLGVCVPVLKKLSCLSTVADIPDLITQALLTPSIKHKQYSVEHRLITRTHWTSPSSGFSFRACQADQELFLPLRALRSMMGLFCCRSWSLLIVQEWSPAWAPVSSAYRTTVNIKTLQICALQLQTAKSWKLI